MAAITFDRLTYLETLKTSGIPEAQARAHAVALDEALRDTVATKTDLQTMSSGLQTLGSALRAEMEIVKRDMTIRIGGMVMALGGMLVAIKYFG